MKIALQIVLITAMTLYLAGVIGEKTQKGRIFYLAAATVLAIALIVTIAIL